MEKIKGYVDHIIFQNSDNGYTVLVLSTENEDITCTGTFGGVEAGETLELSGEYTEHPMYGTQFKSVSYAISVPEDIDSIRRYLESGAVKGVGKAMCSRLLRQYGADTLKVMTNEPERLVEIKGISERIARLIGAQMEEKHGVRSAVMFLQQYGISADMAGKLYKTYADRIYTVIRENPYMLAEDIRGIGFRAADAIAEKAGIHPDSDFRIKSGILYEMGKASTEGHTCLPWYELKERAAGLLSIPMESIESQISNLVMDKKLTIRQSGEGKMVYLDRYFKTENRCAGMLLRLYEASEQEPEAQSVIDKKIADIEKDLNIELDEIQKEAVIKSVRNGLMIISGGPGTGKTTTIRAIIKYFENQGMKVLLAAPTGRAAKRMSQAAYHEAATIHRMLQMTGNPEEGDSWVIFEKNEEDPLEADVIIIDEMSMVDISLFSSLLRAIAQGTRLVLVGDVDQLPSVGPGKVLRDIIDSGHFPVVMLKKIFRQAGESDIVVNAHRINSGEDISYSNDSRDFFFLERNDINVIYNNVIRLMTEKLPAYVGAPISEIQVLTPMRKGNLGVETLNKILQHYINPPEDKKREYTYRNTLFREGDKVMQTKNDYKLEWEIVDKYNIPVEKGTGVFNGDMGIILDIDEFSETMTVLLDGERQVYYDLKQLEDLELAYAITIHKAQGSEYPAVIMPLLSGPRLLMNRNLLYTGVTRAKNCVTILGSRGVVSSMINNHQQQKRYSGLRERIVENAINTKITNEI